MDNSEELKNIRRTADMGLGVALKNGDTKYADLFQHILDIYGRLNSVKYVTEYSRAKAGYCVYEKYDRGMRKIKAAGPYEMECSANKECDKLNEAEK